MALILADDSVVHTVWNKCMDSPHFLLQSPSLPGKLDGPERQ